MRPRLAQFVFGSLFALASAAQAADGAGGRPGQPANWPCWRGPDGSGVAVGCGKALVDDLAEMKLVWRSEERGIPANCWHNETQGGYDSPILADGKVIIGYFKGTGDILDPSIQGKGKLTAEQMRQNQAVATEDTVLCIDAATGKTLWKRVIGEGINLYQLRKGGPHNSPCWHDGKVFAQSTLGRVFCLDAANGKTIWEADGPTTAEQQKVLAAYKKAGMMHPYRGLPPEELKGIKEPKLFMSPLQVADGVVVADSGGGSRGGTGKLVAFDIKTGQKLAWKKDYGGVPLRWACDGKEYFIIGASCVAPRTGDALWQISDGGGGGTPTVGEGYVVYNAAKCFAINAKGYESKWKIDDLQATISVGAIYKGWYYAQVKRKEKAPGEVEIVVGVELATGKRIGPLIVPGVEQCLCTSLVVTDGRLFGHAGAGYSGMWMADTDPAKFAFVGQRVPTVKSYLPLPGGTKAKFTLDYCLTSTPAMADGRMYFRGSDSLYCWDLRKQ